MHSLRIRRGYYPLIRPSKSPGNFVPLRFAATVTSPDASILNETTLARDEEGTTTEQGSFFVETVLPARYAEWDVRNWIYQAQASRTAAHIKEIFSKTDIYGFKVLSVESTPKDGGIFVNFGFTPPPNVNPKDAIKEIEAKVRKDINSKGGIDAWHGLGKADFHRVKGRPWNEDLSVFPTNILKIEFEGPDVHQELLYDIIRPYGRITSMTKPTPVPAGTLRFVTVTFSRIRPAILAKNCLYGIGVADTTLSSAGTSNSATKTRLVFTYERPLKAHWIRDWMSSHPRIVLPIVAFLLGGVTYTIFDPIRSFFIKSKRLFTDWRIVRFFKKNIFQRLSFNIVPSLGSTSAKDGAGTSGEVSASEAIGSPDKKSPPSSIAAAAAGEWKERQDAQQALLMYLVDEPSTIAVIHGPQGSGKSKMLAEVLSMTSQLSATSSDSSTPEPRKTIVIDCTEIYKAGTDSGIVSSLASQTGYWPMFSFLGSMNNLIDLASVGLIGQKAGFSTTVEEQMKEILEVTAGALAQVSTDLKTKIEKEKKANPSKSKPTIVVPRPLTTQSSTTEKIEDGSQQDVGAAVIDGKEEGKEGSIITKAMSTSVTAVSSSVSAVGSAVQSGVAGASHEFQGLLGKAGLSGSGDTSEGGKDDIDWALSAHTPGGIPRILDPCVNALPVVILSGFAAKNSGKKEDLLDVVSGWAASLVENKVAHVIVISDNKENVRRLAKALPSKPLLSLSLGDADPATALAFVRGKISSLGPVQLTQEDEAWVEKLGGRASDLDSLIHKVQNGLSVKDAVQTIVTQGVGELRKAAFGDDADDAKDLPWKPEQAWIVLRQLAKHDELSYAEVLFEFPFKGDEAALRAMEHAELISIVTSDGFPIAIRPGKPIYRYVFQRLVNDNIFRAVQDITYNNKAIAAEEATIKKCEEELLTLKTIGLEVGSSIFGGTGAAGSRASYLLDKMRASQEKIVAKEKEVKKLKVVLSTMGVEPPKA
ncbi:mitochondrial escape protein 2 [Tulasnella sp. UAMH 9824]|nr:mitochondrial escape protein 2 [Tulasnella sp. UAMH 9824]